LDGSEAIRRRLNLDLDLAVALRRGSQHRISRRPTSMVASTSYVAVDLNALGQRSGRRRRSRTPCRGLVTNHQTVTSTSATAVKVKAQVDVNRQMRLRQARTPCSTSLDPRRRRYRTP